MATKTIYLEAANPGNLMFRMMFAEHLQQRLPDSVIAGHGIPEWGIHLEDKRPRRAIRLVPPGHKPDIDSLLDGINRPDMDGVLLGNYGMRVEYFEARRDLFINRFSSLAGGQWTAPDELVMHIRAGDILRGIHPDYGIVPISYYRRLLDSTGLKPVFTGQTGPSFYADALRRSFPEARFLRGNSWIDDFQTTRNAHNIVTSVSSFVWLAAWLSQTAQRIFVPQIGLFNPDQRPDADLVPKQDGRFIYERFPVEKYTANPTQISRALEDPGRKSAYGWTVRAALGRRTALRKPGGVTSAAPEK